MFGVASREEEGVRAQRDPERARDDDASVTD